MAQGRGGEEMAAPRGRGRQEQRQGETGGAGGGGSRTDTAVDECIIKMVDRVARHRFD